jgi:hypothetical protein
MVRFSDMLGGDGDSDDARATTAARDLPPPVNDEPPDPEAPPVDERASAEAEPASGGQSPQDVLDRLTQYATAARAATPPAEARPEPLASTTTDEPTGPPEPSARPRADGDTGDDILPRAKRSIRSPRGKRREQ